MVGTTLGLVAGYRGGWVDGLLMRVVDVLLAFPGLLLALAVVAAIGPGAVGLAFAVAVFSVPVFTRVMRGSALALKGQEFVLAARVLGAGDGRVLLYHICPQVLGLAAVLASLRVVAAILTASALSFLGLGILPPMPEWGAMLAEGREYLALAPHMVAFPGIALLWTALGFQLLGDGLRDALDPRLLK